MGLINARGNYYQVLSMEEIIQTKMRIHNSKFKVIYNIISKWQSKIVKG